MLQMNPDKVCFIVLRARELQEEDLIENPEQDDDEDFDLAHEEAFDELDGHDPQEANPLHEELEGFIDAMSEDEQVELVALAWLGRGDYDKTEWGDALEAAADRSNQRTAEYLLGMPMVADYLEEGLDTFGLSCAEFDEARM
ncbi:DUF3775 domain-containing protein [Aquibaculum arenosum]|uniref:DUF3775 domain-containing protein n=1 Tax=Aquibaculum arenosum TaxID=3032591 RepID=A0ABT5YMU6_9PROT|nr:DUF3775 domain-containing protein [Fodinicurvata sp. CAU 1616]MDF2096287.1 DUF3775 domain-containing protein [Fodinicurvata sp. CAU 1616]